MLRIGILKAGEDRRSPAEPGVLQIVDTLRGLKWEKDASEFFDLIKSHLT